MAESIYDPAFWATFPRMYTISSGSQTTHAITYDAIANARDDPIDKAQLGSCIIFGIEKLYETAPTPMVSVVVGNGGKAHEKTGIGRR